MHRGYLFGAVPAIRLVVFPVAVAVVMTVPPGMMVTQLASLRLLVRDDLALVVHHNGLLHCCVRGGVLVRDGHDLGHGLRVCPAELMLQHGVVSAAIGEEVYRLVLTHPFARIVHAGPPGEVGAIRLVLALYAKGELARSTRPLVCSGEVANEHLFEVQPGVNAVVGEAVEPL